MDAMSATRKRWLMLSLLIGSVLIAERALSLASVEAEVAEPAARSRASRPSAPAAVAETAPAATVRLDRLEARQKELEMADDSRPRGAAQLAPFGSVSWAPPPPPPPAPAPPPKPVAPPFPYTYMGGLLDGGARTAFFNKGERVLVVKVGDTVDGVFRVEELSDKQMQLTYLPLNQSLALALGGGP
jgi:hypothetical protein